MVAEIIGISDEFFQILEKKKAEEEAGRQYDMVAELKARIFDVFSLKVVNEFKRVYLFTQPKE